MEARQIIKRRRFKQTSSLKERLLQAADDAGKQAAALSPGQERHRLLQDARVARVTAELDNWLSSPGSQPPKRPLVRVRS